MGYDKDDLYRFKVEILVMVWFVIIVRKRVIFGEIVLV